MLHRLQRQPLHALLLFRTPHRLALACMHLQTCAGMLFLQKRADAYLCRAVLNFPVPKSISGYMWVRACTLGSKL